MRGHLEGLNCKKPLEGPFRGSISTWSPVLGPLRGSPGGISWSGSNEMVLSGLFCFLLWGDPFGDPVEVVHRRVPLEGVTCRWDLGGGPLDGVP
jgi:hypothetical protein